MGFLSSTEYSVAIFGLILVASVAAAALKNITIAVPDGSSNHGDPNLLCTPSGWTDIVTFFAGNYLAHAATVISLPGESTISTVKVGLSALLFPTSGMLRGMSAVGSFATLAKTDLKKAARSGALCMVVRNDKWKPHVGDVVSDAILASPSAKTLGKSTKDRNDTSVEATLVQVFESPWATARTDDGLTACIKPNFVIHGTAHLPDGYELAYASRDLDFEDDQPPQNSTQISCSYNLVGGVISLAQSIYASYTLYQSRGDQVTRYGYAAFGLTVAPFVVMSIINLVGNLLAPNYPALYLVDSSVMTEARKRDGCHLDGVVGKLKEASVADLTSLDDNKVWIQSLSFNKATSDDQVSVHFHSPSVSTSHSSSADETMLLVMDEENAIEMSNQVKESVHIEEQERTHLVLPEPTQKFVSDDDGTHCVLYIPSCPQVSLASRSKELKQHYVIENTALSQPGIKVSGAATGGRSTVFGLLLSIVPIVIVGALSRFQSGSSTTAQRGWIMAWLTSSIVGGFLVSWTHKPTDHAAVKEHLQGNALVVYIVIFGAPAIGGLVAVGQMIREYGTCIHIP